MTATNKLPYYTRILLLTYYIQCGIWQHSRHSNSSKYWVKFNKDYIQYGQWMFLSLRVWIWIIILKWRVVSVVNFVLKCTTTYGCNNQFGEGHISFKESVWQNRITTINMILWYYIMKYHFYLHYNSIKILTIILSNLHQNTKNRYAHGCWIWY